MKRITCILLCLTISSCTFYQKPVVPSIENPVRFKHAIKVTYSHLKYNWWENFNDAKLNSLVNIAIKNNYDYQVALKNIEIANTYVDQSKSLLFPQVSLVFDSSRNKSMSVFNTNNFVTGGNDSIANNTGNGLTSGRIFNLQQLFGTVSYELDVWNQIGNTVNQANANVASALSDSNVIKLTLISNVVNTYFQIKVLNTDLKNLNHQLKINRELLHYNQSQYQGKLVDITPINDAKNQVENLNILLKNAEKQRVVLINTLAYLLGVMPESFSFDDKQSMAKINYTHLIPAGIPSKMLANRPDIQSAYYQVLSYGYVEKQTLANFLPSFNLTGNYGYANNSFSKFINPSNTFWNYGLNLLQPIFDYKLRSSEYQRAQYQYQASILNYKNTAINAFKEVDNALISYQRDREALLAYQTQVNNSNDKARAAHAQYQGGYGEYATYLTDQLALLQNSYNTNNQQLILIQDIVQIYKTLGLGLETKCHRVES